jgi:Domain of unknown function (DUF3883)
VSATARHRNDRHAAVAQSREKRALNQRNQAVIRLLDSWLDDESGYDERAWPGLKQGSNRLSRRTVFPIASASMTKIVVLAMQAVTAAERQLGYAPCDVSTDNCGYDVESNIPGAGRLRFIEVKGHTPGADIVTVTKNEILTRLNSLRNIYSGSGRG